MANPARDVMTLEEKQAPAPVTETAAIFSMIERASRDESVDMDKFERLMQMQERMLERTARKEYADALAAMQAELPVIKERGQNTNTKSKYALWEDVNEQIRPVLGKRGFAITFRVKTEGQTVEVTGVLTHRGGHSETTSFLLPVDVGPGRNVVQAHGSSASYGKRYVASALLNLTSRGEDDDGKAAGAAATITDEQLMALRELIEVVEADEKKFAAFLAVEKLADLPAAKFKDAKRALETFGRDNGRLK